MKLSALPLLIVCAASCLAAPLEGWDRAAAKYLDDRMDLWFVKSKKLQTGGSKTSCVSCHTSVPYALARPALRKAIGAGGPTPQEARLLDETLRRVETYGNHEPLYKGMEEQSRGTETVLNLFVLVCADSPENHKTLSGPIHSALDGLWKEQRADGAWDWLDFGNEPYESSDSVYYGAAVAALTVGTANYNDDGNDNAAAGAGKMRSYLTTNYAGQNIYNKTWMLLASTRLTGLLTRVQIATLAADLQHLQNADGGWSLYKLGPWTWSKSAPPYEPGGKPDKSLLSESDAYATSLVAYTLREARLADAASAVSRAQAWLQRNQGEWQIDQSRWNCWRTYSLNCDREHGGDEGEPWRRMFMSDAATAFAALALLPSETAVQFK